MIVSVALIPTPTTSTARDDSRGLIEEHSSRACGIFKREQTITGAFNDCAPLTAMVEKFVLMVLARPLYVKRTTRVAESTDATP